MEVLRTRGEFTEQQGRWSAKELLSPFDASSLEPKLSINYPYVRRAFILLLCLALCPSYCSSVCLSVPLPAISLLKNTTLMKNGTLLIIL